MSDPATILLAVGTAFLLVSNGRWIVPIAAWLAPLFLLRYLRLTQALAGLAILAAVMVVGAQIMLAGVVPSHLGLMTYSLRALFAMLWFLPYLLDRVLWSSSRGPACTLVFPAAVTTVEYLNGLIFGTWGSVAYTQYENLPLLQLASVTGIWGVTFLVTWFASLANWAWSRKENGSAIRGAVGMFASLFVLVHLAGGLRLTLGRPPAETVTVGWFTPGVERDRRIERTRTAGYGSFRQLVSADRQQASEISREYVQVFFERTEELARRGARVIAWPEGAAPILEEDEQNILEEAQTIAQRHGLYLLLGYSLLPARGSDGAEQNKSALLDPSGKAAWHYLKTHPVPGASHKAGDGKLPVIDTVFGRISSAICYDLDFPNLIRQAGRAEADLFLAPAWDWRAIDPLHTRMAIVRAIENGFALVRPTGGGLSVATDRYGRVLASVDYFDDTSDRLVTAHVPIRGAATLYSKTGDWLAWLCTAFVLWVGVRSVSHGARGSASTRLPQMECS